MVELIIEILKKLILSVTLGLLITWTLHDSLQIGDNFQHQCLIFSIILYCGISLFTKSRFILFHLLAIPIIAQFLHIFQKYSFPAGANSIWRLFPFILLAIYFFHYFIHHPLNITKNEKLILATWIIFSFIFISISPNLNNIFFGAIWLYVIIIPAYYLNLRQASLQKQFQNNLETFLCLLFIVLALGTFLLIYLASTYKGSDNLLVTRNIADMNITMAYFILLWPFVVKYSNRANVPSYVQPILLLLFSSLVLFSFSRGAFLIVIPYLIISICMEPKRRNLKWLILSCFLIYIYRIHLVNITTQHEIAYFWSLRFSDIWGRSDFFHQIQLHSGRLSIQNIANDLFLNAPIIGHGIGSFEILGPGFREAHSMYYTLLAEVGLVGTLYFYAILGNLLRIIFIQKFLFATLVVYIIYNHSVGMVFVIIPANSISLNCIAPTLLLCIYYYCTSNMSNPIKNFQTGIQK